MRTRRKDTIRSLAREARDAAIKRGNKTLLFTFANDAIMDTTASAMEAEMRWDMSRQFGNTAANWPSDLFGAKLVKRIVRFIEARKAPVPEWAQVARANGWTPPSNQR